MGILCNNGHFFIDFVEAKGLDQAEQVVRENRFVDTFGLFESDELRKLADQLDGAVNCLKSE
jgi:hypothetical protein